MKIFIFFLFPSILFAAPEKIEVWFLSFESTSHHNIQISNKLLAQNDCIPMGEGCFNPQTGYVGKKDFVDNSQDLPKELKTFNAQETELVNCDKDYFFDIYCGKAKAQKKPSSFEIWVDTSSSMKNVDYSRDPNYCYRRTFIEKLTRQCSKRPLVSLFNTSKKIMGTTKDLCMNYGNNNLQKLKQWVKASSAKNLVIITDIDEMNLDFKNFMDQVGASAYGEGQKPFYASELMKKISSVLSYCH